MKLAFSSVKHYSAPAGSPQERQDSLLGALVLLGTSIACLGLLVSYFAERPQFRMVEPSATETVSATEITQTRALAKGDEVAVPALTDGQVEWIAVREGDQVSQGQIIAQLQAPKLQAQLEQIQAQLAAAKHYERQVIAERESLRERLWDAYLKLRPEDREVDEWVRHADEDILAAEAELAKAEAELQQARDQLEAVRGDRDRFDMRQQKVNQLEARVRGLRRELRLARGAWVRAVSSSLSPYIHSAELDALRQEWVQVLSKLSEAQEKVFQLEAQQHELEARQRYLTITSPVDGVVVDSYVQPGDVVHPGKSLLTIAEYE